MVAWCHGAVGIGLARLGLLRLALPGLAREPLERDLERAVAATLAFGTGGPDRLCCGNAGHLELLAAAAADGLGRPSLRRAAAHHAAAMLERARRLGRFLPRNDSLAGVERPSLFQGLAGIGCALLRLGGASSSQPLLMAL